MRKKVQVLYYGVAMLASAIAITVATPTSSVSASSVGNSATASSSKLTAAPVAQTLIQMSEGGSATYGRWVYQYTAQPYAFFSNTRTGKWKMVQVTSYTQHTINVIINGYEQTFERYLKGQYARP